jgi:hypothetical protein
VFDEARVWKRWEGKGKAPEQTVSDDEKSEAMM